MNDEEHSPRHPDSNLLVWKGWRQSILPPQDPLQSQSTLKPYAGEVPGAISAMNKGTKKERLQHRRDANTSLQPGGNQSIPAKRRLADTSTKPVTHSNQPPTKKEIIEISDSSDDERLLPKAKINNVTGLTHAKASIAKMQPAEAPQKPSGGFKQSTQARMLEDGNNTTPTIAKSVVGLNSDHESTTEKQGIPATDAAIVRAKAAGDHDRVKAAEDRASAAEDRVAALEAQLRESNERERTAGERAQRAEEERHEANTKLKVLNRDHHKQVHELSTTIKRQRDSNVTKAKTVETSFDKCHRAIRVAGQRRHEAEDEIKQKSYNYDAVGPMLDGLSQMLGGIKLADFNPKKSRDFLVRQLETILKRPMTILQSDRRDRYWKENDYVDPEAVEDEEIIEQQDQPLLLLSVFVYNPDRREFDCLGRLVHEARPLRQQENMTTILRDTMKEHDRVINPYTVEWKGENLGLTSDKYYDFLEPRGLEGFLEGVERIRDGRVPTLKAFLFSSTQKYEARTLLYAGTTCRMGF